MDHGGFLFAALVPDENGRGVRLRSLLPASGTNHGVLEEYTSEAAAELRRRWEERYPNVVVGDSNGRELMSERSKATGDTVRRGWMSLEAAFAPTNAAGRGGSTCTPGGKRQEHAFHPTPQDRRVRLWRTKGIKLGKATCDLGPFQAREARRRPTLRNPLPLIACPASGQRGFPAGLGRQCDRAGCTGLLADSVGPRSRLSLEQRGPYRGRESGAAAGKADTTTVGLSCYPVLRLGSATFALPRLQSRANRWVKNGSLICSNNKGWVDRMPCGLFEEDLQVVLGGLFPSHDKSTGRPIRYSASSHVYKLCKNTLESLLLRMLFIRKSDGSLVPLASEFRPMLAEYRSQSRTVLDLLLRAKSDTESFSWSLPREPADVDDFTPRGLSDLAQQLPLATAISIVLVLAPGLERLGTSASDIASGAGNLCSLLVLHMQLTSLRPQLQRLLRGLLVCMATASWSPSYLHDLALPALCRSGRGSMRWSS